MKRIRVKASYFSALLIALIVIGWMISDNLWQSEIKEDISKNSDESISSTDLGKIQAITVNAIKVQNEQTPLIVRASGVTTTLFELSIVARRKGTVKKIYISEGSWIEADDLILELDVGTLKADLEAA